MATALLCKNDITATILKLSVVTGFHLARVKRDSAYCCPAKTNFNVFVMLLRHM